MARRSEKPRHGEGAGNQILVRFNLDDPQDMLALTMARQLASKHGSLSKVIRGFLLALVEFQRATGVELNADTVTGMFLSGILLGGGGAGRAIPPTYAIDGEEVEIIVGTANRASGEEIAINMAMDIGDMFSD
jgi:hypothetical protein